MGTVATMAHKRGEGDNPLADYQGPDKIFPEEAAALLGVPTETVRGWYKRGKIPKYPRALDNRVFVSVADIVAAMTPGGPVWADGSDSESNGSAHDNPSAE